MKPQLYDFTGVAVSSSAPTVRQYTLGTHFSFKITRPLIRESTEDQNGV